MFNQNSAAFLLCSKATFELLLWGLIHSPILNWLFFKIWNICRSFYHPNPQQTLSDAFFERFLIIGLRQGSKRKRDSGWHAFSLSMRLARVPLLTSWAIGVGGFFKTPPSRGLLFALSPVSASPLIHDLAYTSLIEHSFKEFGRCKT